ncbi:hypothetical protein FOBRF1_010891 [Fusarium oxysporum]
MNMEIIDNPILVVILLGFCLFHRVEAASDSPEEAWNEFTNNFATDIAPLITLFGEQVTKQFLSESTGFLDNVIFGMAPLGILTAVVSAIRVYGWPSLKAFIGRAQEPHGVAEAELCSSTSHDVCELWSEGGICRVFGRPKVLEFVHKPGKEDFYPELSGSMTETEVEEPGDCNIYRPVCFFSGGKCCQKKSHGKTCGKPDSDWEEDKPESTKGGEADSRAEDGNELNFAPYANLSLNIGIRLTPRWVLATVAFFATLLQLSFFVYATIITFHRDDLYDNGEIPEVWAFILAVVGTAMVVLGMILCSFLIERRSKERRFVVKRPKPANLSIKGRLMKAFPTMFSPNFCRTQSNSVNEESGNDTLMYWLQPGNQRIGDQQFNAFSHNMPKRTYVTSWKTGHGKDQLGQCQVNLILLLALFSSVVGFVLQFIGLRGLHGSIALYQIAATLFMSIIRALLRQRGLGPGDNGLQSLRQETEGKELDWQAMEIVKHYQRKQDAEGEDMKVKKLKKWRLYELMGAPKKGFSVEADAVEQITIEETLEKDKALEGLSGFRPKDFTSDPDTWPTSLASANEAIRLASHYEHLWEGHARYKLANSVAMAALIRSRLAYLTSDGIIGVQPKWDSPARSAARELQLAIQGLTNYVFSGKMALKDDWRDIMALTWHTAAAVEVEVEDEQAVETGTQSSTRSTTHSSLSFPMFRYGREWKISKYRLEAVLGLSSWSPDRIDDTDEINEKVLLVNNEMMQHLYLALHHCMPAENLKFFLSDPPSDWSEAWLVQARRLVLRGDMEDSTPPGHDRAITMRARSSRIKLQAQGIFTIFLSRLASIFHMHEKMEREFQATDSTQESQDLWEGHVKAMTKLFVRSGLGTEEEAFMCIIPVLVQTGHLPQKNLVAEKLFQLGLKLRRQKKFSRAEIVFKIMLDDENKARRKTAFREIGEVYRKAYRACQQKWALEGLQKMTRFWQHLKPQEGLNISEVAPKEKLGNWPRPVDFQKEHEKIFWRYNNLLEFLKDFPCSRPNTQKIDDLRKQVRMLRVRSPDILTVTVKWDFSKLDENNAGNLLILAVRQSYPELVDDILESHHGLIENMMRGSGWQLSEAMKKGVKVSVIKTLLNTGEIQVNMQHDAMKGETILSLAIRERRSDIVRWLLKLGASVNAPTRAGNAIFSCVADENDQPLSAEDTSEFMALLLDNGVKVNTQFQGETVVKRAVKTGNLEAATTLIARGAGLEGQMLLNEAAIRGDKAMLHTLLQAGLDLKSEMDEKVDPRTLPFTSMGGSDLPKELIRLSRVTSSTGTALHSAILAKKADVVEMLLRSSDLDVNTQINGDLGYAITMACFLGDERIFDLLLEAEPGVDVNSVGQTGSALAIACARKDLSMVQKLLGREARITSNQGHLKSPLVVACLQNCDNIARELLSVISLRDEYLNDVGVGGFTALCAAVKNSNFSMVEMLLKHGADANKSGGAEVGNVTPFQVHLKEGKDPKIAEILGVYGAEKEKSGPTINSGVIDTIHSERADMINTHMIDTIHLERADKINTHMIDMIHLERADKINTQEIDTLHMNDVSGNSTINLHNVDTFSANNVQVMKLYINGQISAFHTSDARSIIFNSDASGNSLRSSTRLALEDL